MFYQLLAQAEQSVTAVGDGSFLRSLIVLAAAFCAGLACGWLLIPQPTWLRLGKFKDEVAEKDA